jgi:multiple sugar transport system substrate-binding protein
VTTSPSERLRNVRLGRATAVFACTAALALTAACTGSGSTGSKGSTGSTAAPVTITFWHGWSAPNELASINTTIAAFEKANPTIKVKSVGNDNDDKINQALRAGGANAPDVVSTFTTNNVGLFCSTHEFADLTPFMKADGIDPATTFPKSMLDYTSYKGDQCALPQLGDAFGLYYNVDMFKAAGITSPPKTLSEFDADAVKLTKTNSTGGYTQLGFMPTGHGYETQSEHLLGQWGPSYFTSDGKSNIAADPAFTQELTWQKNLTAKLGGFAQLEKYRTTFGDEFSAKNPFETGKVAMAMDGEWRVSMLKTDAPSLKYATAPFPVPDALASTYGRGYQTGTIIGMASNSKKQAAAWKFLKFMTTDTPSLVQFANAISNVPSTSASLKDPGLDHSPQFQTFLDIASNPNTNTTPASPNGGKYLVTIQNFEYQYESGKVPDLAAGLKGLDTTVNNDLAQAAK